MIDVSSRSRYTSPVMAGARFVAQRGVLKPFIWHKADVTVLNIGAAFWGLVAGIVVSLLLERPDFARSAT